MRFSSSLFKEGWLSASGIVEATGTNTLQILFDKYWVDFGATKLRQELGGIDQRINLPRIAKSIFSSHCQAAFKEPVEKTADGKSVLNDLQASSDRHKTGGQ